MKRKSQGIKIYTNNIHKHLDSAKRISYEYLLAKGWVKMVNLSRE
jgi:hypothetical protein